MVKQTSQERGGRAKEGQRQQGVKAGLPQHSPAGGRGDEQSEFKCSPQARAGGPIEARQDN